MKTNLRFRTLLAAVALGGLAGLSACAFNPQPEPPGGEESGVGESTGPSNGVGLSTGTSVSASVTGGAGGAGGAGGSGGQGGT